jgi:RNA polymerase sigma factor (sigma-70 family)
LARAFARWSRVSRYDEAWVTRVVTNLALGVARRQQTAHRHAASDGPRRASEDTGSVVALRHELVTALRQLPRRQREVVALRYLADLPEARVAVALGCSVGSVKQHASRGLAALRAALAPIAPASDGLAPVKGTP